MSGVAHAQDSSDDDRTILQFDGTECDENANPIAGSSGLENARHALRTTAQTYSAANYAEQHLFPEKIEEDKGGDFSFEFFQMMGASRFPSYESRAGWSESCPDKYRVSMRALDLQAMVLGLTFRKGNLGGFYAASVAYGNPAMPNNIVRGMMLFGQPMYAGATLAFAPLARNGFSTQQGASAFALDWVGGITYDSPLLGFRGGYAGSRGFYGNVAERGVGLFLSGMLGGSDRGSGLLGFAKGGLDRTDVGAVIPQAGLTSAYVRDLPYGQEPAPQVIAEEKAGLFGTAGRLRTVHLQQANIAGFIDLGGGYAFLPVPQLNDLSFSLHSPNFVPRRDGSGPPEGFVWMARGGPVWIPGSALLGLEDGEYYQVRVEVGFQAGEGQEAMTFSGAFLLNDPELLALYPYAVNAPTIRLHFDGSF